MKIMGDWDLCVAESLDALGNLSSLDSRAIARVSILAIADLIEQEKGGPYNVGFTAAYLRCKVSDD
jgi:hypothetical protein